jgi:hypothetical protein
MLVVNISTDSRGTPSRGRVISNGLKTSKISFQRLSSLCCRPQRIHRGIYPHEMLLSNFKLINPKDYEGKC